MDSKFGPWKEGSHERGKSIAMLNIQKLKCRFRPGDVFNKALQPLISCQEQNSSNFKCNGKGTLIK